MLMPTKKGPFKVIEVPPTTITIDKHGIWNTVSTDRDTLAPSEKFAEREMEYTPDELVDKPKDKVDKGAGQTDAEELADKPLE